MNRRLQQGPGFVSFGEDDRQRYFGKLGMWFSDELKHKISIAGFEALAPDHLNYFPLPTAASNLAALSRKPNT